ncbi:metal-sulfur cluster assembly factor [bacterium]|nr:metal-sulfur cluster assembly factor [bacterium]
MIHEEQVREALREVVDPELGLDIVTLGLVYELKVSGFGDVSIRLTLTTPGCPMEAVILSGIYQVLRRLEGLGRLDVALVWEPRWGPERIEAAGRKLLGLAG